MDFKKLKIARHDKGTSNIFEKACILVFKSFYRTIKSTSVDLDLELTKRFLENLPYTSLVRFRQYKEAKQLREKKRHVLGSPTTCQAQFPRHFTLLLSSLVKKRNLKQEQTTSAQGSHLSLLDFCIYHAFHVPSPGHMCQDYTYQ